MIKLDENLFKHYYQQLPKVREIKDACGLTWESMGEKLDVSVMTLWRWDLTDAEIPLRQRIKLRELLDSYRRKNMSREIIIEREKMDIAAWFRAIATEDYKALKTAGHMQEGEDSQGGFLSPEIFMDDLTGYKCEESIARPRSMIVNMTSDSLKGPRTVETDRSSGVMFGGISYKWASEKEDLEVLKSKPTLGQLEFTAHKLIATFWASNELIADSRKFTKFIEQTFGRGMSFIKDDHFINGTGVGQILGIMNSNAMIHVPRQEAGTVDIVDFGEMTRRFCPESFQSKSSCWIINQDVAAEFFNLNSVNPNPMSMIVLNDRNLFGLPIIVSSTCQALGTPGDVILADWSYYCIADRELRIASSQHQNVSGTGWASDDTLFRLIWRGDGQPLVDAPIIPRHGGGDTISPFVCLDTFVS